MRNDSVFGVGNKKGRVRYGKARQGMVRQGMVRQCKAGLGLGLGLGLVLGLVRVVNRSSKGRE